VQLQERGLSTGGKKADLVARLQHAIAEESTTSLDEHNYTATTMT
jgi:hypothetical protein